MKAQWVCRVCGYNFVVPFDDWMPRFESLLAA